MSYAYLFKYIIIGDTGTSSVISPIPSSPSVTQTKERNELMTHVIPFLQSVFL